MADKSGIEWTDATWNPVTGCSKVSPGCAHCYAETLSLRYGWSKKPWTPENALANVVLHPERLGQPLRWTKPRMVFVNSMSDLFHELIPDSFIAEVYTVMGRAPQHTFQVLTKRPERARAWYATRATARRAYPDVPWQPWPLSNVWLGVSIENARFTWRADVLREIPAAVRFVSAEPLLGSLLTIRKAEKLPLLLDERNVAAPLDISDLHWLIAGGESGHNARPMRPEWARELRNSCEDAGVPFFFKQWGGRTPKAGGRLLDGQLHDGMPELVAA